MLVSEEKQFVFVHVPKTGGKSIVADLRHYCTLHSKTVQWDKCHRSAISVRHHLPTFEKYFSFAFVRNPWDRAVSRYEFSKKRLQWDFSFAEYLKKICDGSLHCMTQTFMTYDEDGKQLVDFIGRFENIQQDYDHIRSVLKLPAKEIKHENRTSHKPYEQYYDDELRDLVSTLYQEDIMNFNYCFGSATNE